MFCSHLSVHYVRTNIKYPFLCMTPFENYLPEHFNKNVIFLRLLFSHVLHPGDVILVSLCLPPGIVDQKTWLPHTFIRPTHLQQGRALRCCPNRRHWRLGPSNPVSSEEGWGSVWMPGRLLSVLLVVAIVKTSMVWLLISTLVYITSSAFTLIFPVWNTIVSSSKPYLFLSFRNKSGTTNSNP